MGIGVVLLRRLGLDPKLLSFIPPLTYPSLLPQPQPKHSLHLPTRPTQTHPDPPRPTQTHPPTPYSLAPPHPAPGRGGGGGRGWPWLLRSGVSLTAPCLENPLENSHIWVSFLTDSFPLSDQRRHDQRLGSVIKRFLFSIHWLTSGSCLW